MFPASHSDVSLMNYMAARFEKQLVLVETSVSQDPHSTLKAGVYRGIWGLKGYIEGRWRVVASSKTSCGKRSSGPKDHFNTLA